MPGSSGTGQPITFQCSQCRKKNLWRVGRRTGYGVTLTGRKRTCRSRNAGIRNSTHTREYVCDSCGHVGWSRHIALGHQEKREAR